MGHARCAPGDGLLSVYALPGGAEGVSTGHLVYGADGSLRGVRFDPDRLDVVGTLVPILEDVAITPADGVDSRETWGRPFGA